MLRNIDDPTFLLNILYNILVIPFSIITKSMRKIFNFKFLNPHTQYYK